MPNCAHLLLLQDVVIVTGFPQEGKIAPAPSLHVAAQGSARVIRCLQDAREELTYECRATLFDAEVRMAEDIDFKYPMKRSCTSEIKQFCPGIEHGSARIIRCLQVGVTAETLSAGPELGLSVTACSWAPDQSSLQHHPTQPYLRGLQAIGAEPGLQEERCRARRVAGHLDSCIMLLLLTRCALDAGPCR